MEQWNARDLRIAPPPLGLTRQFTVANWSTNWCIAELAGDVVVPGSQVDTDLILVRVWDINSNARDDFRAKVSRLM